MTKSILFLVAVVCAVGCVDRTSLNDGTREAVASRTILLADSMSRDTVDLGRMRQGEIVRQRLLLENGYREPMVILSVSTSCGCTSAEFDRHPVQPGALFRFFVRVRQQGIRGRSDQAYHAAHIGFAEAVHDRRNGLCRPGNLSDRRMKPNLPFLRVGKSELSLNFARNNL